MTVSLRRISVFVVLALVATMFSAFPPAFAALDSSKTTSVTLDVDGNTVDLAKSVTNNATPVADTFSGGFGGTGTGDSNKGDLVTGFFPARGGKLVRLLAQGGVVKITGDSCGAGEYYQRARVTLLGVPSGSRVWAFYDPSVGAKQYATFQENPNDDEGESPPDLANDRIASTASLPTLCDGTTRYVAGGTEATINLGSNAQAENPNTLTTAGTYKDLDGSATSIDFDVYVPMEGTAGQSTSIFLALGFVVDAPDENGAYGLNDATADVGITAWVSSRPWWLASEDKDEAHTLLSSCSNPSASADPCIVESASGIFGAGDGLRDDSGYSVELETIMDAPSLEARLTLAPTAAIGSSGFSVPDGSIAKISVSWPTSGAFLGGPVDVGDGANQLDFSIALADTPIKVDPKTTSSASATNRWDIDSSGGRVVTTLIGEAKSTSSGISQDTWWPQCSVDFTEGGAVNSEKCGADMTSNVSDGFMVFSSVPAEVNLMINPDAAPIAGGLVSTNGQGFAFGPETFSATAFQFAVSGPSFTADGSSRAADGFYYVCIPGAFLDGGFDTTSTVAAANWSGTRDGAAAVGTAFAVGNCGVGADGAGLVAELDPFGYSSPLFRLAPTPVAAPQASGGGGAAAPVVVAPSAPAAAPQAPVVVAPSAGVKVPLRPSSARFAPEIFAGERSAAQALVGGKLVDVTSSVEGSQKATFEVGSVTLGLGVAADEGAIGSNLGAPTPDVKRGGSVALDMTGLRPETSLRVFFPFGNGSFAELPSFSVGEDGSVSGDLRLDTPGSQRPLQIGAFSLQFVGQDEDDNEIVVDVPIEVRQPDPAPEVNRFSGDRPALSVNELVAFNGGAPENVVSEASADGVSITGADWQMAVGDGDPGTEGLNFTPGEANTVAGEGFMPGTRVDIWLFSTPMLAGSLEVNDEGEFSSEFVVDVATGNHTLQIQGVGADGFIRAANLGVTVVEPTTEAMNGAEQTTSSGMTWLWWVIGLLLVTGAGAGALLWLSRRTRAVGGNRR